MFRILYIPASEYIKIPGGPYEGIFPYGENAEKALMTWYWQFVLDSDIDNNNWYSMGTCIKEEFEIVEVKEL